MKNPSTTLSNLILSGIFTAVITICAWITVPLPFTPVPINFALLAIYLTGGLLGAGYGLYGVIIYILLGAVGVPVFAGFSAGLGVIAGPTGGFIVGYILCVIIVGLFSSGSSSAFCLAMAMVLGLIACYGLGIFWFMHLTHSDLAAALTACVLPFLLGDALKIFLGVILIKKLRPVLERSR